MGTKYAGITLSGFNASPPADDGTVVSTNKVMWAGILSKAANPLKTMSQAMDAALLLALDASCRSVTANYACVAADHTRTVQIAATITAAITVTLADAATMTNGYIVTVANQSAIDCTVGRANSLDTIATVAANVSIPSLCSITFIVNAAATGYIIHSFNGSSNYVSGNLAVSGNLTVAGQNVLDLIEAAAGATGGFSSFGLSCYNDTGTPNTLYTITSLRSNFVNAGGQSFAVNAPANVTNNVATAGPIAGGRDQSGAFSASSWIYFYRIRKDDGTLSSLSSASSTAPTLPTGYTQWCLCAAVRFNASSQLVRTSTVGSWANYQGATVGNLLSGASTTTGVAETPLDTSALVPPNATMIIANLLGAAAAAPGSAASEWAFYVGFVSGQDFTFVSTAVGASASTNTSNFYTAIVPNVGQNLYYKITRIGGSGGTGVTYYTINSYQIPNGAV